MSRSAQTPVPQKRRLVDTWRRLLHIYHKEIWQSAYLKDRSFKGCTFAVLRVISITLTVFVETRLATRAAALTFSSLLGLGPLLAIAVLVAGFALGENDSKRIADTMNNLLKTVAPQLQEYEYQTKRYQYLMQSEAEKEAATGPQLETIIDNIIKASRSGSAGTLGAFSLVVIVLLLFKAIEDTFNDIWGVRQGRSVMTRIVFYWTILTLGAVIFLSAVGLLSAGTIVTVFKEKIPGGEELVSALGWTLPIFSFTLLASLLTLFYRVIPNTRVYWSAAFGGGLVVAALLMLNQFLAFLYVKRVVLERSLYGSLAILPVLMLGLYTVWLFVLIGGIVSYAIQNVHFRNSQAAWSTLTETMRERLTLVVFLTICRRFRECLPPISASHLSTMLKVPAQLLNECLNRLVQIKLVTPLQPEPGSTGADYLYQPSRPLNRLTLFDFKTLEDNFGEDPIGASLERIDPLISHYDTGLNRLGEQDFFQKNLEQLFAEHPFDESRPPFAMGERRVAKP